MRETGPEKGDPFVIVSVDQDGMATIAKTAHVPEGGIVFPCITTEYEYLAGSVPAGRFITEDYKFVPAQESKETGSPLPELEFDFED